MTIAALSLFLLYGGLVTFFTVYFFYRILSSGKKKDEHTENEE